MTLLSKEFEDVLLEVLLAADYVGLARSMDGPMDPLDLNEGRRFLSIAAGKLQEMLGPEMAKREREAFRDYASKVRDGIKAW